MNVQPDRRRNEPLIEVMVFLFLIVPSMVLSFFVIGQGGVDFSLSAIATIFRDLSLVSLIGFFLWRNREPIRQIGWTASGWWREIALGIVLFIPVLFGASYLDQWLRDAGFSGTTGSQVGLTPQGTGEFLIAFILVVVVAVAEEIIFRGYLLLRFEGSGISLGNALLLSALIFALGHGYEGAAGVITVGAMGFVFALVYKWRASLIAPITMHMLQDMLAIVILPLLGQR